MIIIRDNRTPKPSKDTNVYGKLQTTHKIIVIREATDRAFDEIARKMTRSFNQRNERRSKR